MNYKPVLFLLLQQALSSIYKAERQIVQTLVKVFLLVKTKLSSPESSRLGPLLQTTNKLLYNYMIYFLLRNFHFHQMCLVQWNENIKIQQILVKYSILEILGISYITRDIPASRQESNTEFLLFQSASLMTFTNWRRIP